MERPKKTSHLINLISETNFVTPLYTIHFRAHQRPVTPNYLCNNRPTEWFCQKMYPDQIIIRMEVLTKELKITYNDVQSILNNSYILIRLVTLCTTEHNILVLYLQGETHCVQLYMPFKKKILHHIMFEAFDQK